MFCVINTSVASLRQDGGNLAPEYMATIIPEWVATIVPECMATMAGIRTRGHCSSNSRIIGLKGSNLSGRSFLTVTFASGSELPPADG